MKNPVFDDDKTRLGFAIGTGIVPAACALVVIGVTADRWDLAVIVALVVWVAVAAIYYGRARRK
jgi:uncharacterized membrane protein